MDKRLSKNMGLKVGDRLRYVSDDLVMRRGEWKRGLWFKRGTTGTVTKLNNGSKTRKMAWATFTLDGDDNAKIVLSFDSLKDYVKVKQ